MFQRIHQKLGTAGFIISIVALVAALGGGAYAASGGLTGKQKKEVEKIAKKFAGKPGAAGANGTNGTNGAPGAKGDKGDPGANGTNGTNGAAGTSVTNTALPKGNVNCPEGGAEFKVGGGTPTRACNGTTGFTNTLPKGATETGTWSYSGATQLIFFSISFNIPYDEVESPEFVFVETAGEEATKCPGGLAEPKAAEGFLCVYQNTGESIPAEAFQNEEIRPTGANLLLINAPEEMAVASGTWAVTAE